MEFKNIHTRFRAYQMTVKGSSFSYWESDNDKFTLGEARYNDDNKASIHHELSKCGKETIDNLYISSWEMDHCTASELEDILKELKPSSIYAPLYEPDPKKENQVNSKKLVDGYAGPPKPYRYNGKNLNTAKPWTYTKTYHNQKIGENANDNSLVCLWRTGNFSVLSVGDLESATLSKQIEDSTIYPETDVFILSHHGS
ncbi:MAG: hypothetical protein HRT73_12255, partial [Flavobacteriales bacterium]|nr:hypothetical protein [Flavobacteriales bacterium]